MVSVQYFASTSLKIKIRNPVTDNQKLFLKSINSTKQARSMQNVVSFAAFFRDMPRKKRAAEENMQNTVVHHVSLRVSRSLGMLSCLCPSSVVSLRTF